MESELSGMFHKTFSNAFFETAKIVSQQTGIKTVALSGGVFQNLILLSELKRLLEKENLNVLVHRLVPPNDGGISLGQAAVALEKTRRY